MEGNLNRTSNNRPPFPYNPVTINHLALNHIKDFATKVWRDEATSNQYYIMFRALELYIRSQGIEPGFVVALEKKK